MADSILALHKGFEFQAQWFWYKACNLFLNNSNVANVSWEIRGVPGFDDVSISYINPFTSSYGQTIEREHYQVKFHVSHENSFSCNALTDPAFIGATSESLLQKLYKNYLIDPLKYQSSVFNIVNTWGLDNNDLIKKLLDNNGAIIFERLFDGTTDTSKAGKVRKAWREHLILQTDDELKKILRPLRIIHNAKSGDNMINDLNLALNGIGLRPVEIQQRTSPYKDLIIRLQEERRNVLTREDLKEILTSEKLWVSSTTNKVESSSHIIGVRTFRMGTDGLEFDTEALLCLLHYFEGRFAIDEGMWYTNILPELKAFSERAISVGKPLLLHLDTHLSVAFTMGYYLNWKTGIQISVFQKMRNSGRLLFEFKPKESVSAEKSGWTFSAPIVNEGGKDIVLAVGVTHSILNKVQDFVNHSALNVYKSISAEISPHPSPSSIKDGSHIMALVDELIAYCVLNNANNSKYTIHLFIAAPNAFAFFFGQASKILGQIKLYEFDFDNQKNGNYHPVITLPF